MKQNLYHVFFRNLANKDKIKIISLLKKKDLSVNELSESLNIEQSSISHTLSALKYCSIVNVEQKGKKRIYSLNKKTIVPLLNLIDEHTKEFCKNKK